MRIIGIDPSLRSTGYGIIEYQDNEYIVHNHGTVCPESKLPLQDRIYFIKNRIEDLITDFSIEEVAIENLFFARNVKTAIILGQVRGAILVAVAKCKLPLYEYSPLEIKKAVTGYGQADKNQVQEMIRILLRLPEEKLGFDASDALAAAVCHLHSRIFQQKISVSEGK